MLKKTITYEDYDGQTRTEDFYFNLTEAELQRYYFEHSNEGMFEYLKSILLTKNTKGMMDFIAEIINISFGVKSEDGKRFVKDPNLTRAFSQTEAYSTLYMELMTKEGAIAEFLTGCMPKKALKSEVQKSIKADDVKDYVYGNKSLEEIVNNANT